MNALVITTVNGDIVGVVLRDGKGDSEVSNAVEALVKDWVPTTEFTFDYSPTECEQVAIDADGCTYLFYVYDYPVI